MDLSHGLEYHSVCAIGCGFGDSRPQTCPCRALYQTPPTELQSTPSHSRQVRLSSFHRPGKLRPPEEAEPVACSKRHSEKVAELRFELAHVALTSRPLAGLQIWAQVPQKMWGG